MAILNDMKKKKHTPRWLPVIDLLLSLFILSGCMVKLVMRELTYHPSKNDPYIIWDAYITDSGLLLLCGSVNNGRESMEGVIRYYNLELRLEGTIDPESPDVVPAVQINEHPSLRMIKGYPSDLCQFDEKRAILHPEETGWTEIFLKSWDEGFIKITPSDLDEGRLPVPPAELRIVLYEVVDTDPPEYLLIGRFQEQGLAQNLLLILGPEHIKDMW